MSHIEPKTPKRYLEKARNSMQIKCQKEQKVWFSYFTEHGKVKYICKDCKGTGICEHNRCKRYCQQCKGTGLCEHDLAKSRCFICSKNPILACNFPLCEYQTKVKQRFQLHQIFKNTCIRICIKKEKRRT